jgi:high-affinity nickel-transport protein
MSTLLTSLLGLVIGMRHALEPDHLAAISTLATENKGAKAGLWLGALWGLGHSLSLLVVGGALALLEAKMPDPVALGFELAVSVMILGLGVRAIAQSLREGRAGRLMTHAHGPLHHAHAAPMAHVHLRSWTLSTRPLLIGVVHGLAGSGALTALVLAELPSTGARLAYIAVFGLGSVVGMALLTGLAGVSLRGMARSPRLGSAFLGVAGLISSGVGVWWGFETGVKLLALPG